MLPPLRSDVPDVIQLNCYTEWACGFLKINCYLLVTVLPGLFFCCVLFVLWFPRIVFFHMKYRLICLNSEKSLAGL